MFLEENSIGINGLSLKKKTGLPNMGSRTFNLLSVQLKPKRQRRENSLCYWAGTPFPGLWFLDLHIKVGTYSSSSLDSQALNPTALNSHCFFWVSTYRWQTLGLSSLHNHITWPLIINFSFFCHSLILVMSFGKPQLIVFYSWFNCFIFIHFKSRKTEK